MRFESFQLLALHDRHRKIDIARYVRCSGGREHIVDPDHFGDVECANDRCQLTHELARSGSEVHDKSETSFVSIRLIIQTDLTPVAHQYLPRYEQAQSATIAFVFISHEH